MIEDKIYFEVLDGAVAQNVYYEDFIQIGVYTKSQKESNDILNSIWREADENLPQSPKDKCPWMYMPCRKAKNGKSYLFFGKMNTKIGEIMWACSFEKKGTLNEIAFLPLHEADRTPENLQCITEVVETGIKRVGELFTYTAECEISGRYEDEKFSFADYTGKNFQILNVKESTKLVIVGQAYQRFDFHNKICRLLADVCNFLTVETNALVDFEKLDVYEGDKRDKLDAKTMEFSDKEFIDFIPINSDEKLLLQKEAINLLDDLIEQEQLEPKIRSIFDSANVFREGLEVEYMKSNHTVIVSDTQVLVAVKKNVSPRVNMVSSAISLYMSALENLTSLDANPEQCSLCGQLKYGITSRVGDIADKCLNRDMAKVMKKLYSMRSKYLHTANSFCIDNCMYTIPQVDNSTEIGCRINGGLSIMIDGNSFLFTCMNVHEWVSYILRQTISDRI